MRFHPASRFKKMRFVHVDVLRGLAVISVVLFHFFENVFPRGYLGVDVFFVVSGYLITRSLLASSSINGDVIRIFYIKRVRKVVPPLLPVLIFSGILGTLFFSPDEYKNLIQSISAQLLSISNVLFWWESGYFQPSAAQKPLLHTWSLSVEMQFYAIAPWLLIALVRAQAKAAWICVTLCVTFFVLYLVSTIELPDASYYLLPFRLWQFIAGAAIAFTTLGARNRLLRTYSPQALYMFSAVFVLVCATSNTLSFGPAIAALTVTFASCIVLDQHEDEPCSETLWFATWAWLGRRSYSLYLWHWPILVFARYFQIGALGGVQKIVLVVVSVFVADISYRLIERPITERMPASKTRYFAWLVLPSMLSVILLVPVQQTGGLPGRFAPDIIKETSLRKLIPDSYWDCPIPDRVAPLTDESLIGLNICTIPTLKGGDFDVILWGDSHANALRVAVGQASRSAALNGGYSLTAAGCPPMIDRQLLSELSNECRVLNELARSVMLANSNVSYVVIHAFWSAYFDIDASRTAVEGYTRRQIIPPYSSAAFLRGLESTVGWVLGNTDAMVLIVGPVPNQSFDVPRVSFRAQVLGVEMPASISKEMFEHYNLEIHGLIRRLAINTTRVTLVEPAELLCSDSRCGFGSTQGLWYHDDNHLSKTGSEKLVPLFRRAFSQ